MRSCQLLFPLLRGGLHREQDPNLQEGEWRELTSLAGQTSLSFQVLQAAGTPKIGGLPSDCRKTLVAQVRHTAVRNALQQHRLQQLLEACAGEGIPVMLLKGLWLVHCVYGAAEARESGDIDLLFRPEDMSRFTQVAGTLGFEVPLNGSSLSENAQSTNECALRHPDCEVLVDVHWSLTNPSLEAPIDEQLLWQRSELVRIGELSCGTLGLEDHLLYLCFHAAVHHRFCAVGPRCLYDVAMVIRQPPRPIQWTELVARAQALGWERAAWLVFALVGEHLGVHVPAAVMQALHRESPADQDVRRIAMDAIFSAHTRDGLYRQIVRLLEPQPWTKRVAVLCQLLFPSRGQLTSQFGLSPPAPTCLLYLKHWDSKLSYWMPKLGALLLGNEAQRQELARTRQIERWLSGV